MHIWVNYEPSWRNSSMRGLWPRPGVYVLAALEAGELPHGAHYTLNIYVPSNPYVENLMIKMMVSVSGVFRRSPEWFSWRLFPSRFLPEDYFPHWIILNNLEDHPNLPEWDECPYEKWPRELAFSFYHLRISWEACNLEEGPHQTILTPWCQISNLQNGEK